MTGSTAAKMPLPKDEWTAWLSYVTMYGADPPPGSYNQNLWMHHLTEGAAYLPL